MSVIHFRRMGRLPSADSYPSPGRGQSWKQDIPDDERGIKFEIDRMVKYVKDFRADPVVVKTARRVVQLCAAKDKHCEMAALFTWTKGHFRYVNDPVNAEAIQTPPAQIAEILTPPDVIRAVLGEDLIQQMQGFGIGGAVLAAPNQVLARGCFRDSIAGPMWHKTSGDCDEGATFLATMLAAIGISSRFQFGGSLDADGRTPNWHHVWTGGYDESSGKWIDMDITEERSNLGWRYPNFNAYGHVPIFNR
jgi:hypothetical protein